MLRSAVCDEASHTGPLRPSWVEVLRRQRALALWPLTYGLPAPYDAHYLAVAESEDVESWTGEKRLYEWVHGSLDWGHWLGE